MQGFSALPTELPERQGTSNGFSAARCQHKEIFLFNALQIPLWFPWLQASVPRPGLSSGAAPAELTFLGGRHLTQQDPSARQACCTEHQLLATGWRRLTRLPGSAAPGVAWGDRHLTEPPIDVLPLGQDRLAPAAWNRGAVLNVHATGSRHDTRLRES